MDRNLFPAAEVRQADDLDMLAQQINAAHAAGEAAVSKGLEHYRAAGEALLRAKTQCGHGKWLTWLKENVRFSQDTATRYMRFAEIPYRAEFEKDAWASTRRSNASDEEEPAPVPRPVTSSTNGITSSPAKSDDDEEDEEPDDGIRDYQDADEYEADASGDEERHPLSGSLSEELTGLHVKGRAKTWLTVDEWKALSADQRKQTIADAQDGDSCFNRQENDSIEWAKWSWNPVSGCRHDCPYCYARDIAERFYPQKFEPSLYPGRLGAPGRVRVPEAAQTDLGLRNVFTCSMADLFGRWVPEAWIKLVLAEVRKAPQWNFLFLTKFPIRLAEFDFPDNAWVGTTVDCQIRVANAERAFRKVNAKVKWLSCEPMIEPLKFSALDMFQWVVIGGASSSSQTPEWHPPREWSESLRKAALKAGCQVYEKTNLLQRFRDYPGFVQPMQPSAPAELKYLPTVEAE